MSKMTSYVVRTNNAAGFDIRATASMPYTHAAVSPAGDAYSWHTSEALARKAASTLGAGFKAVKAEAHPGAKATVSKRIAAEIAAANPTSEEAEIKALREKGKAAATKSKTPSASAQAKEKAAEKAEPKAPRTLAATEGEQACRVCQESKPLTSFPTKAANKAGEILRDDRCRACRAIERDAKKAAKAAPAPAAPKATKPAAKPAAKASTKKAAKAS